MNHSILQANLLTMGLNLIYAVAALVIGIVALIALDRFLFPQIDFVEEIKKGNIAAAIVVGMGILFLALLLSNVR